MVQALRLAPDAVVVPPRFDAYAEASEAVFAILAGVTPLVEPLSLDEAFLDVTASIGLFGAPAHIATTLRARIAREVKLPASAGIATVKFVAKMASDLAKPDGQKEVAPGDIESFLAPLPASRLWGVGRKTEEQLKRLGLHTIADLARQDPAWLGDRVPGGRALWELARGIDPRPVIPDRGAKSIGSEDTFGEDLRGVEALRPHIHSQALRVGRRLRLAGGKTRVVQLKVKLADFTLLTRRATLPAATDDGQMLYRTALALLDRVPLDQAVRLTGVSAQDLAPAACQLALFAPPPSRSEELNTALDRITDKFGSRAVTTADVAGADGAPDPWRRDR